MGAAVRRAPVIAQAEALLGRGLAETRLGPGQWSAPDRTGVGRGEFPLCGRRRPAAEGKLPNFRAAPLRS